jgi:hypothetical protein
VSDRGILHSIILSLTRYVFCYLPHHFFAGVTMKTLLFLASTVFSLLLFTNPDFAQPRTQAATRLIQQQVQQQASITASRSQSEYFSTPLAVPLTNVEPFLCISLTAELNRANAQNFSIWIRTTAHAINSDDAVWSEWVLMNEDAHAEGEEKVARGANAAEATSALAHRRWVSKLMFLDKGVRFVQYKTELHTTALYRAPEVCALTAHFFSPGATPQNAPPRQPTPFSSKTNAETQGAVPRPKFMTRTEWGCPWGQTAGPNMADLASTDVTILVVHHSFEPGNNVTDWPAAVRGVWNFHVMSNGWSDIGYNWLIDPNGTIYQGRAWIGENEDTRGAHFCGANTNTMGVCMLGNYSQISAPEPALASLVQLLAYKASARSINPLGQTIHPASNNRLLNTISGHRDGICATECPGNLLYPVLPDIRTRVASALRTTSVAATASVLAPNLASLEVTPNPASEAVTVRYSVPQFNTSNTNSVRISIYNALGARVAMLHDGVPMRSSGEYTIDADTASWPAGMYTVQLQAGAITLVARVMVAR